MKASIKRKLTLGVGLQFLLIAVSVVVGMIYVNVLRSDTSNILSDNFKTLEYCNAIAVAIDDQIHPESAVSYFRENLEKQQKNVTEPGELELTNELSRYFKEFEVQPADSNARLRIRNNLNALIKLNMDAIAHKSQVALKAANAANIVMGTVGTVSFVLAFILLLNLPNIVADPIKEFVASTKEIAKKNYAWRTDELRNDEFGELAKSFNSMAVSLEAYENIKLLDAAKTNFIATVSHEFKTPISAIKMSLQLLQNAQIGPLNEEQSNLVDSIKDDADRLLRITRELLDFTQVESGHIHLNMRPVELKEIVDYALSATRTQAEQKQVRLDVVLPTQLPPVMADSEKTAWVITNLISNAIRYSYEHATVAVTAQVVDDRVRVEVKDTGQGIAPQYQTKVFERYFRVPGTMQEGSGLGLAISKEFIETQGGNIGMKSEFGAGSVFWIELVRG